MFKLYRLGDDEWLVTDDKGAKYSSCRSKTIRTLIHMGVDDEEILEGIKALLASDHNLAHYGYNKTFIFSERVSQ